MNHKDIEEIICKPLCHFFKPSRIEEDRCRGFSLAGTVLETRALSERGFIQGEPFTPSFKKSFLFDNVCSHCPFLIGGCDFTSPEPPEDCPPCGGLIWLSKQLKAETLTEADIRGAHLKDLNNNSYVRLASECSLKSLEQGYVYDIVRDELYEVNQEAYDFLHGCDGTKQLNEFSPDPSFLSSCIEEDILRFCPEACFTPSWQGQAPFPSLRYLEWLVTYRCNLSCAHCYLGDPVVWDFPLELIRPLLHQFSEMQGLRILVSGGEPTLYENFHELNSVLKDYPVRTVLLTNGLTMTEKMAAALNFHEVQVSLDGMEKGHEAIRGKGTFQKVISAMNMLRNAGLDLSLATMVHSENLGEWEEMGRLVENLGVREWSVDYPCCKGRWLFNPGLHVGLEEAADRMAYAFGGSYHGTSPGWTCGRHLAAVLPSGQVCRCGLYREEILGSVLEGLKTAWLKVKHIPISETLCKECIHADTCGGGCRFRAGGRTERDAVMCQLYRQEI